MMSKTHGTVAALYVQSNGVYFNRSEVDPWDIKRDALKFTGDCPVIAHPPCQRWCRLAGLNEARYGHKKGDDGGTFKHALEWVRRNGGVLEHPAYSDAWPAFALPRPEARGGWAGPDRFGGYSAHIEQGNYGFPARKKTWLYAVVKNPKVLPELRWGPTPAQDVTAWVSRLNSNSGKDKKRISKHNAEKTPPALVDVLITLAQESNLS